MPGSPGDLAERDGWVAYEGAMIGTLKDMNPRDPEPAAGLDDVTIT